MITFQIGILGAGNIAAIVADTINQLDGFSVAAIASRDADKAKAFAAEHNIPKSYGSYEELAADDEIELIYIATPHSHHAEQAKMCINHGKPVLVEKPLSYNMQTAKEVFDLARDKKVFCAEAMWLRYTPMVRLTADLLKEGVIGDVRLMNANLGYDLRLVERIVKPELAGGALLDLGVYPLNLALMMMNEFPAQISSSFSRFSTGPDAMNQIQLIFPKQGKMAMLMSSALYNSDNTATIYGTKGRVEITDTKHPTSIRFYDEKGDKKQELAPPPEEITGYEYEFIAARKAIICGDIETPEARHQDTLMVLQICDSLRKSWGIQYPLPNEITTTDIQNPLKKA